MSIAFDIIGETIAQDERMAKSQKFRLQIRRKQKQDRFKLIRRQFAESLKSLQFLEELKSQRDNLNVKKIRWVLEGLSVGLNNVNFYKQITNLQLEPYLCEMILSGELNIEQKGKILRTLVQFLYFNDGMPNEMLKNRSFFDYICETLGKVNIRDFQEENFVEWSLNLLQNLLYYKNGDFAEMLMGSGILKRFHGLLDENDDEKVYQKRIVLMKIYKNLFKIKIEVKFAVDFLRIVLGDQRYINGEQIMRETLRCVKLIMSQVGIWGRLNEYGMIEDGFIEFGLVSIFGRILGNFSGGCFSLFLGVLSEILEEDDEDAERSAINIIQEFSRQKFLLWGLSELNKGEQNEGNILYICQVIKMVARTKQLRLNQFVYGCMNEHEDFLRFVMKREIVVNIRYNKYLIRILSKMLDEDNGCLGILRDYGVIDVVCDSLNDEVHVEDKVDVIELVERLIWAEENLREEGERINRIDNIFYERGVIEKIENMQDDENSRVYKRAEQFMKRHSQIKREQN